MLVMTKIKSNLSDSVDYKNTGPKLHFLSVFTHARDRYFFHVRACYRLMAVVEKAMHTASKHNIYRVCSMIFKCA